MNEEILKKIRTAKNAEEVMAIAKASGTELNEERANEIFAQLNRSGELSDEELNAVAGGGCNDYTSPSGLKSGDRVLVFASHESGRKKCPGNWEGVVDDVSMFRGNSACTVRCPNCGISFILLETEIRKL